MKSICVFCGSAEGRLSEYRQGAILVGHLLAEKQITLVYGGAKIGLMGAVADACLAAGGTVIGVIPKAIVDLEIAHHGLTELRIVDSMHERKALMADLADGFVALPGGYGTLDELFEIVTWSQLGFHQKPIGLLNVSQFFDPLLQLVGHCASEGFIRVTHQQTLFSCPDPESLLAQMEAYVPPPGTKWNA